MTPQQARKISDYLLEEARRIGQNRTLSEPEAKFYAKGAAADILLALSGAFDTISFEEDPRNERPAA